MPNFDAKPQSAGAPVADVKKTINDRYNESIKTEGTGPGIRFELDPGPLIKFSPQNLVAYKLLFQLNQNSRIAVDKLIENEQQNEFLRVVLLSLQRDQLLRLAEQGLVSLGPNGEITVTLPEMWRRDP